jgi:hypothetical protein
MEISSTKKHCIEDVEQCDRLTKRQALDVDHNGGLIQAAHATASYRSSDSLASAAHHRHGAVPYILVPATLELFDQVCFGMVIAIFQILI